MFEIPQRPAAADGRDHGVVVSGRRRACEPFERPRIPRIVSRQFASPAGPHDIDREHQNSKGLKDNADGYDQIPDIPAAARLVSVDASRHAEQARYMHEIEREMEADEKQPEV